ncbi:ribonuclease HII [filamentous cyanobacterium CCP5]|nr:ribonuclease HII [filamentous cyanobacterium CCP5]
MSHRRLLIAGVDEVGRGAVFGPVVAAAVILDETAAESLKRQGLNDSKKLSPQRRQDLVVPIRALAIDCQVGMASVREIERLNILQASLLAMRRAVLKLTPVPDLCRVDGNQLIPELTCSQEAWIKGDQRDGAIAAASVIAKVWRDDLIVRLARHYPGYALESNKGYGSHQHRSAIQQLGLTRQHRRSFRCCQMALPLELED